MAFTYSPRGAHDTPRSGFFSVNRQGCVGGTSGGVFGLGLRHCSAPQARSTGWLGLRLVQARVQGTDGRVAWRRGQQPTSVLPNEPEPQPEPEPCSTSASPCRGPSSWASAIVVTLSHFTMACSAVRLLVLVSLFVLLVLLGVCGTTDSYGGAKGRLPSKRRAMVT